jgi:5'-nucleotidase
MEESSNVSRRKFLAGGVSLAALSTLPAWAEGAPKDPKIRKLTILHTNDWHSRIDPFPDNDPKYPGQGGAARRAALISKIRQEEEHVLLLDAGDVFQGTPYFNYYGGEPEFKLMSMMGYDAGTLGNHDFDNGIEGFVSKMPFAKFPFINCNYDFTDTLLNGKIKKSIIVKKNGIKIGILGVGIDLAGLVPDKNWKGLRYTDPIEAAHRESAKLKLEKRCDFVICLSHIGFKYETSKVSDHMLASGTEFIDLIIGGHTHTFLEKPVIVMNKKGDSVTINQVGFAGLRLGRIDCLFSSISNSKNEGITRIKLLTKSIAI